MSGVWHTLLQIDLKEGASVAPHYRFLHPNLPIPKVTQ